MGGALLPGGPAVGGEAPGNGLREANDASRTVVADLVACRGQGLQGEERGVLKYREWGGIAACGAA